MDYHCSSMGELQIFAIMTSIYLTSGWFILIQLPSPSVINCKPSNLLNGCNRFIAAAQVFAQEHWQS